MNLAPFANEEVEVSLSSGQKLVGRLASTEDSKGSGTWNLAYTEPPTLASRNISVWINPDSVEFIEVY